MNRYQKMYVKFFIKKSLLYYSFLGMFIIIFIVSAVSIKVNVINTYSAVWENDVIILNVENSSSLENIEEIYFYKNRNEKIYKEKITRIEVKNGSTYLYFSNETKEKGKNQVTVEVVVGKQSLLKRIFSFSDGGTE